MKYHRAGPPAFSHAFPKSGGGEGEPNPARCLLRHQLLAVSLGLGCCSPGPTGRGDRAEFRVKEHKNPMAKGCGSCRSSRNILGSAHSWGLGAGADGQGVSGTGLLEISERMNKADGSKATQSKGCLSSSNHLPPDRLVKGF